MCLFLFGLVPNANGLSGLLFPCDCVAPLVHCCRLQPKKHQHQMVGSLDFHSILCAKLYGVQGFASPFFCFWFYFFPQRLHACIIEPEHGFLVMLSYRTLIAPIENKSDDVQGNGTIK